MTESTPNRYHPALVAIHWLMALLVVMMLGVGKFAMPGISPEDPQKPMMLQSHTYIGGAIALLLIVRLVLRFTTKRPAPADAPQRHGHPLLQARRRQGGEQLL